MQSHEGRTTPHVRHARKSKKSGIINDMPPFERTQKMTLRLTPEEVAMRDALAKELGINISGVLRMGLRELARIRGVNVEKAAKPQGPAAK